MNERETGRTADVETEGGMQADTEREKKKPWKAEERTKWGGRRK